MTRSTPRPSTTAARRRRTPPPDGAAGARPAAARRPSPRGVLDRAAAALAMEVRRRVPRADLDQRDQDYIRDRLPFLWLLSSKYFRAEVRGMGNIPEQGPVLLVGNHSGGNMIVDTFVFTLAFSAYFGVERRFHQLAHNLVLLLGDLIPYLPQLTKFGTIAASHENAGRALAAGAAVLVYPGGDHETHRPSWESSKVDFAGRKGFIRLALKNNVPIVPVVSIGGQETALFLTRGEGLARMLRLDRLFRLKVLPISLAVPWGLNVGDMLLHFPIPAKIAIEVLPAIDLRKEFGQHPDIDEIYSEVVGRMQDALTKLASARRFPVVG